MSRIRQTGFWHLCLKKHYRYLQRGHGDKIVCKRWELQDICNCPYCICIPGNFFLKAQNIGKKMFELNTQTDLLTDRDMQFADSCADIQHKKARLIFCISYWNDLMPPILRKRRNFCKSPVKLTTLLSMIAIWRLHSCRILYFSTCGP